MSPPNIGDDIWMSGLPSELALYPMTGGVLLVGRAVTTQLRSGQDEGKDEGAEEAIAGVPTAQARSHNLFDKDHIE